MEGDIAGLDFTFLDIDLVSAQNNRDVLAYPLQVSVPVGYVFVGDSGSNVEHDDTTLTLDVISVSETTELLLSCRVPNVEADRSKVGVEGEGVDFNTKCS